MGITFDPDVNIADKALSVSHALFSSYQSGLLPKEEPFETKVELPPVSPDVYLKHSLLRMY